MEKVQEPKVKIVPPELRLEDIAKDQTLDAAHPENKGNAAQQLNALLANASREFVHFINAGKNPGRKCKAKVTLEITMACEGCDQDGRSILTVVSQLGKKMPAPLPKTDSLMLIETERGTPSLAAGHPDDETPLLDGAQ